MNPGVANQRGDRLASSQLRLSGNDDNDMYQYKDFVNGLTLAQEKGLSGAYHYIYAQSGIHTVDQIDGTFQSQPVFSLMDIEQSVVPLNSQSHQLLINAPDSGKRATTRLIAYVLITIHSAKNQ
jgi:hypothetical protein